MTLSWVNKSFSVWYTEMNSFKIEIMNLKIIFCLIFFLYINVNCTFVNNRPIIGILSEEFSENSLMHGKSFITTPYVKFVEASGARVVPILIYKPKEYYQDILNKINGVLLPGGNDLLKSAGYGRAGKIIFNLAVEMNDKGDYFPVWGTCLGFELLNLAAAGKMWMKRCSADDVALKIDLTKGFERSRMFSSLSTRLKDEMQTQNLTIHFHHWCITPQNFSLSGLDNYFKVLALNTDSENTTFVSVIEADQLYMNLNAVSNANLELANQFPFLMDTLLSLVLDVAFKYPFYGTTFHPEKVVFDWSPYDVPIPHTAEAIEVSHYFGNFFISEARKNFHKFPSKMEEDASLIYNYSPQRDETGTDLSAQMYIFQ